MKNQIHARMGPLNVAGQARGLSSPAPAGSVSFLSGACVVEPTLSIAYVRIHRHFEHQPIVYAVPAAANRMPYFPQGSVDPHFLQRICQPGALSSGFMSVSSANVTHEPRGVARQYGPIVQPIL